MEIARSRSLSGPLSGCVSLAVSLTGRIARVEDKFDVAVELAEAVLSSSRTAPPLTATFARASLALMAVQQADVAAATNQYVPLQSARGVALTFATPAVDRLLGLLAHIMVYPNQAEAHFEEALVFRRKGGYRTELAWSCCDYADMLLDPSTSSGRAVSDNRTKAMSLLDESLAISTELGMRPLMERVLSRREILKS